MPIGSTCVRGGSEGRLPWLAQRALAAGAVLLLAACSGGASQQIDALASDAATARLVAADRLTGAVPSHYAGRLLAALASEVETSGRSLTQASLPSTLSPSAHSAARELRTVIHDARCAVASDDAPRLRGAMLRAQALHDRLDRLSKAAEAAER